MSVPAGAASHPPGRSVICYTPAKRREIRAELSTALCEGTKPGFLTHKEVCFSVFRCYLHGADHGTEGEYSS